MDYKRPISLSIACIYAMSALPIHVLGETPNENSFFDENSHTQLIARFAELEEELRSSDHRFLEAFSSLNALIQETNAIHNMSFTLQDVIDAAKIRIEQEDLELDAKSKLLKVIENFSSVEAVMKKENQISIPETALVIGILGPQTYFPWTWNWFKSKKKKLKSIQLPRLQVAYPGEIPPDDPTIPNDLIIAGVEFLAAALLFIIPSGVSQTAAAFLVADGANRLWNGVQQRSEFNRNQHIYPEPPPNYKD